MFKFKKSKKRRNCEDAQDIKGQPPEEPKPLHHDISSNIQYINAKIGLNSDIVIRKLELHIHEHNKASIIYFKTMVNEDGLNTYVIKPLSQYTAKMDKENISNILTLSQIEQISDLNTAVFGILKGKVLLIMENSKIGYLLPLASTDSRSIEEPNAERVIRGSREGFIERIDTNIFLLRRKMCDPNLVVEELTVGTRTNTRLSILYIKDIINDSILAELKNRIKKIETDSITGSGMLEQFIEDSPISIFPQIQNTERAERTIQALLEGRICILTDGTPFALLVPSVLPHFLAASEDYYQRTIIGSFNRFLRYAAVFITVTLPSLYIALTLFHSELIPSSLLIPLAEARKEIPFPPLVEAFILEIAVEFLREMGVRLPQPISSTLGVVGGIVLGEAAVRANLVSPAMVIVVGATAVISFTIPSYSMVLTLRFIRFFMMILAGMFGVYGITIGWVFILGHLMRLESFSIPYLSPFAPLRNDDLKDTVFRTFIWKMKYRPEFLHVKDKRRQNNKKTKGEQNE